MKNGRPFIIPETHGNDIISVALGDVTIISTSGLQLLLGLSRFQERGWTDASPLCSGCSLVNVFRQNRNNEVQHDVFLMLLLYFSSYFWRKC